MVHHAAEGDDGRAQALLRSGPGTIPEPGSRPAELDCDLLTLGDLVGTEDVGLTTAESGMVTVVSYVQ